MKQRTYWKVYLKKLIDKDKNYYSIFKNDKNLMNSLEMLLESVFEKINR